MPMPRGKRAGSKTPTVDYDAGCLVRSTSTKCPTKKFRTSSSPPISRPESAWASRAWQRCANPVRIALLHLVPESRINRKLAAILAADVVGYSRLMGADEAGTLAALKRHRETIFD